MLYFLFCLIVLKSALLESKVVTVSDTDLLSKCDKTQFVQEFVNKGRNLNDKDYNTLYACASNYKKCNQKAGRAWVSFAQYQKEDRFAFIYMADQIIRQDCWGYSLQITDNKSSKTEYYNFKGNKYASIVSTVDVPLGHHYNFTIVPLPSGIPVTFMIKAPNLCQLDVISQIYQRLEKKEIFKDCISPDYISRLKIAKKICNIYPDNAAKRWRLTKRGLREEKCKFILANSWRKSSKKTLLKYLQQKI